MNLLNKFKVPLYSFFKLRTPYYIISKKNKLSFATKNKKNVFESKKRNNEFYYLLTNGMVLAKNLISKTTINNWTDRYKIYKDSFHECEGNISFPFYNKDFHDLLFNSDFLGYLNTYYDLLYGKKPVLQTMPTLVVTKPDMNQSDFSTLNHNFPAVWHTDYITEFTIHIPLVNINNKTNHTKYLLKSHTNFLIPPVGATKVNEINNKNCFADVGDALFIDVDGWHRGHLEKGSFRAMIQLKYTIGNNELFFDPNNPKIKKALERTAINTKNYDYLKNIFKEDYEFFKKTNPDFSSPHAKTFLNNTLNIYSK
tara:strand:+ start:1892 stop:2824 length:933 start_codon:yes stop_codon:yes gene_type:complete